MTEDDNADTGILVETSISNGAMCSIMDQFVVGLSFSGVRDDEHPDDRKRRRKLIKAAYRIREYHESASNEIEFP